MSKKEEKKTKTKKGGKVKKAFKIIGIIIFTALVVFAINLVRKTIIIQKIERASIKYDNTTNYYKKRKIINTSSLGTSETIDEIIKKDNIIMYKNHSEQGTTMLYRDYNKNTTWVINNKKDENGVPKKIAIIYKNQETLVPETGSGVLIGTDNFLKCMNVALYTSITSEDVEGQDCYKVNLIYGSWISCFSKENLSKLKEIQGNVTTEVLEESFDKVTDEDIKLPDLTGYEIVIGNEGK